MDDARIAFLSFFVGLVVGMGEAVAGDMAAVARAIREAAGFRGGVIVHVGCGDGPLTAALHADDRTVVQGLDVSPERLQAARRWLQEQQAGGQVSVALFDGRHLPYADNLVNLVVLSAEYRQMPESEILRVLRPGGVCITLDSKQVPQIAFRKPWPEGIDQWTHFLHDASNNAVASDRVVGPPRHVQWVDGPLWSRSHEYDSSLCAMVSANGRIFYIFDEGPTGIVDPRIPDRWMLTARDAFNGMVLWKRPVPDWGWRAWRPEMAKQDWRRMPSYRCASPLSLPRRLVAVGDRVFTTLGYTAPVVALDAATGKTVRTYAGTRHADEILWHAGRLVLCVRPPHGVPAGASSRRARPATARLMAFDAESGRELWHTGSMPITRLSLAASDDGVFCHSGERVIRFDWRTGRPSWSQQVGRPGVPLVTSGQVVLCVAGKKLKGLAAADGRLLWELPAPRGWSVANPPDLFVIDGLVWFNRGSADANSVTGFDLRTGQPARTVDFGPLVTRGHHARCYRSKATVRYLLLPKRGVEFVDLHGEDHSRNNWLRGACRYGLLPCNGLLYSTPHPCFCYAGVKLGGFLALAPATGEGRLEKEANGAQPRLTKGPAFDRVQAEVAKAPASAEDWSCYRHDPFRSGSAGTEVAPPVTPVWSASLGGKLTQPVIAGGRVFVARKDTGTVLCLDAADGRIQWKYRSGARIDSSPTWYRGLLIFGSADGSVSALLASSGELAWRFRAAPADRQVVSFGQLESAWPVHGSVFVFRDTAYVVAGRSSFLDGGLFLYGLDPLTGEVKCQTTIDGPWPDVGRLDQAAYATDGAKTDLLVTDGSLIYLFHNAFDTDLTPQPVPVLGQPGVRNLGERRFGEHLFSNAGFLDDSWFSRNHWMLDDHWTAFNFAHQAPKEGQLIVFDDSRAYAVKVFARRNRLSPLFFPGTDGYFLVADRRSTRAVLVNPRQQSKYLTWLPQEGKLQRCWNLDVGFARATPPEWMKSVAVRVRAMVLTGKTLWAAGTPDEVDPDDPLAALEGRRGARLLAVDTADGRLIGEYRLEAPPVFDGLSAAAGHLFLATRDGRLICFAYGTK